MPAAVGQLRIDLVANIGKFASGMKKSTGDLSRFQKAAKSASTAIKQFGGSLGGIATIGGLGFMVQRQIDLLDALGKTSDRLGINIEQLQELRHAAGATGVSIQTLEMGLQRMVKRIGQASAGTGEAVKVLEELRLDPGQLAKLAPDRAFVQISERINELATQYDKVRVAAAIFDSEGVALVNTMALGADGLANMAKEARNLGKVLDEETVRSAENAKQAIENLKDTLSGAIGRSVPVLDRSIKGFQGAFHQVAAMGYALRGIFSQKDRDIAKAVADEAGKLFRGETGSFGPRPESSVRGVEAKANRKFLNFTDDLFDNVFGGTKSGVAKLSENLAPTLLAMRATRLRRMFDWFGQFGNLQPIGGARDMSSAFGFAQPSGLATRGSSLAASLIADIDNRIAAQETERRLLEKIEQNTRPTNKELDLR